MELEIATPHGPALADLVVPRGARALLVIGHGAGGGVNAPDIVAAAAAAAQTGAAVARITQPYRVAGRRSPAPAEQLDTAWLAVIAALRKRKTIATLPLIVGGRSSGARVACRTANEVDAAGVLCLAFPVHPPGKPEATRLHELDAPAAPVLVVQGQSDPFGMPPRHRRRTLVVVPGDNHGLKKGRELITNAVAAFVTTIVEGVTV